MFDFNSFEDVVAYNERSLKTLTRAITLSIGKFSLILVRCKYASLQQQILQHLHEQDAVTIREIVLPESAKTLYTAIQTELGNEQPSALIILGLDTVTDLDHLLLATNQVRDEFPKSFPFPIVLFVTDEVLQKLMRLVPDFNSWAATPIQFVIDTQALIHRLRQEVDTIFTAILNSRNKKLFENINIHLEQGSHRRQELKSALHDLESRGRQLEPDLDASLKFVLGQNEYTSDQIEQALELYQQSLNFWQQNNNLERQGVLLFHIALCFRRLAETQLAESNKYWQQAKATLQICIHVFEQAQRLDLVAKCIDQLGEVLRRLQAWEELQVIAQKSLNLHQTSEYQAELAQDYAFLAEVALAKSRWDNAQQLAQQALQILERVAENQRQNQGWYLLLLAKAQQHLDQPQAAIASLERAVQESQPQYDPQLYIDILEALRSLYYTQGQYLAAFVIKQKQLSIEQQYGFRAFIGAVRLEPQRQAQSVLVAVDSQETVAQEIAVSNRQQDINRLVERICRDDCVLTIIHGQSGVGKSSLINAGLVPTLKKLEVATREVLPITQRVYTDWVRELWKCLVPGLAELRNINLPTTVDSTEDIIEQLIKNENRNLLTVLIFDQFEEFFFNSANLEQRLIFFNFLHDCLNIPFVKVILSLREDYLHYLLEIERLLDLEIINNNILDKKIRYYLGNLSPEDAKFVIESITQRSHFYLESALINELVNDLAGNSGEVRPIELQVVGSQIQTDDITTLEKYHQLGSNPKEKLVERYLAEVIHDCGSENESAARTVLYLLTDENNTRPLKTHNDLELELAEESGKLDLVLDIFVKSGLVLLLPEIPANRYQLVHDYLVYFIRQQREAEIYEELKREKKQRQFTEAELNRVLQERLEEARLAAKKLTRVAVISATLAVLSTGLAALAVIFWNRSAEQAKLQKIGEIATLNFASGAFLAAHDQLGALVASVKAGKQLLTTEAGNQIEDQTQQTLLNVILTNVQERNRLAHSDWVYSVSFSPDGKLIASGSADNTVKLWRANGTLIRTLGTHSDRIASVTFSPNGQLVASAGGDGTIKLWRIDGTLLRTIQANSIWINSLSFSPDGQTVAAATSDNSIKFWRINGTALPPFQGHKSWVLSVSFSPDGKTIASGSADKTVKLWRLDGTVIKTFEGHTANINKVRFSPNGQTIASVSDDSTVKLWRLDGKLLQNFTEHQKRVFGVDFSPDGRRLASASEDRTVKIWRLDGILLHTLQGHKGTILDVRFSPDSQTIASAGYDNSIRLWRLDNTLFKTLSGHRQSVVEVDFSPDSQLIVSASADNTIKLWQRNGRLLRTFKGHSDRVKSVSFSPDGQTIASASGDRTIKLWNLDGKELKTLQGHTQTVASVNFSPDGQLLASASGDRTIKLWRRDGSLLHTLKSHTSPVNYVKFSPDGQTIASASDDKTFKLWSREGKLLLTSPVQSSNVTTVSFSPDGKTFASSLSNNTFTLWQINGTLLRTFSGHQARINSVNFSPDGKMIASASADNTIKLWQLDGKLQKTLQVHTDTVYDVKFSPDGQMMASASADNTVILWNLKLIQTLNLDVLLIRSCNWLHDYLTTSNSEDSHLCDGIFPNSQT